MRACAGPAAVQVTSPRRVLDAAWTDSPCALATAIALPSTARQPRVRQRCCPASPAFLDRPRALASLSSCVMSSSAPPRSSGASSRGRAQGPCANYPMSCSAGAEGAPGGQAKGRPALRFYPLIDGAWPPPFRCSAPESHAHLSRVPCRGARARSPPREGDRDRAVKRARAEVRPTPSARSTSSPLPGPARTGRCGVCVCARRARRCGPRHPPAVRH